MGFYNKIIKEKLSEILKTSEGFKRFCYLLQRKGNYKGFDPLRYYQKNKEKIHLQKKEYREKHKDKIKEYMRKYHQKKKEEKKMSVGLIQFWSYFKNKLNIKEDEKGFSKTLNFLIEKYCNNNFDYYLNLYSLFCDYINTTNDQVKETSLNELEKHLDKMKKILAGAGESPNDI